MPGMLLERYRARMTSVGSLVMLLAAIAVFSLLPSKDRQFLHFLGTGGTFHAMGHLFTFGCLGGVAIGVSRSARWSVALIAGVLLFGWGIEMADHLLYHDWMEWRDVRIDSIGTLCGGFLVWLLLRGRVRWENRR